MGHLRDSIHIDAPVEKVDKFTDDPHNWPTFMEGMGAPDKVTGDGGVGTEVEFTVIMAGVRLHETSRVVEERRDPDGGSHVRFDIVGPMPAWQTWDLKPENGGSLVSVEMEYTLPGSVLGKVADRLVGEKMGERDIHHGLENLKLLMESSPS